MVRQACLVAVFLYLILDLSNGIEVKWTTQTNTTKYWVLNTTGNFSISQRTCSDINANLLVLFDHSVFLFVTNWLENQSKPGAPPSFYVNAVGNNGSLPQQWGDGSSFPGGALWGPHQPNDDIGSPENCISLRYSRNVERYFIFDDFCNFTYNIICQQKIAAQWSEWESWSSCSSSCVLGIRVRNRSCQHIDSTGLNMCDLSNETTQQTKPCNTHLCNETYTITTKRCNASCNEVGFMEQSLTCVHSQIVPTQCRNRSFVTCSKKCFESGEDTTTQPKHITTAYISLSNSSSEKFAASPESTTIQQIQESSSDFTPIQPAQPFGQDILIAICVGVTTFLFLLLLMAFVLFMKHKKRNFIQNKRELPAIPLQSLHRASQHRRNLYSNTEITSHDDRNHARNIEMYDQTHLSDENSSDGAYVSFKCVRENDVETEGIVMQQTVANEKIPIPVPSDYIEMSELERACTSRQGSNKSSSNASVCTSGSDVRTLEFDYVTVSNLKREGKYSSLDTLNSEPKQWSDTYDIIVR